MTLLADFLYKMNILQIVVTWVLHWIGKFFVIGIFLISSTALLNETLAQIDIQLFNDDHWLLILSSLVYNNQAWAPATAVLATTVAMGHFRTLELNIEKEKRERDIGDNKRSS